MTIATLWYRPHPRPALNFAKKKRRSIDRRFVNGV